MTEIIYRDIQNDDFEKIMGLIQETWNFEDTMAAIKTRHRFIHALLTSTLLTSSWGQVAVEDDRLVGFIMGVAKADKRRLRKVSQAKGLIMDIPALLLANEADKRGIKEYLKVPRAYQAMRKGKDFSAEITFLAVSGSCQGLGIGKQLMNGLMSYFDSMKVRSIGVFTDSNSNFGFYEHQGFSLLDTRAVPLTNTTPARTKTIFLYGYEPGMSGI